MLVYRGRHQARMVDRIVARTNVNNHTCVTARPKCEKITIAAVSTIMNLQGTADMAPTAMAAVRVAARTPYAALASGCTIELGPEEPEKGASGGGRRARGVHVCRRVEC